MKRVFWLVAVLVALATSGVMTRDRDGFDGDGMMLRVPAKFATIQQAVDAAQPGDVVEVGPGTYCEEVSITKSDVRVRGRKHGDDRPTLSGACLPAGAGFGVGFKITGTATAPVTNVEISGFVVDSYETGIMLQYVVGSRIAFNDVSNNARAGAGSAAGVQNGIVLATSSFNEITGNTASRNGHMGIAIRTGSNGNTVRENRLFYNQQQWSNSCSLMVFLNSTGNRIIDNLVVDDQGNGIMLGNGASTGATQALANLVGRNRVYGHPKAGIVVEPLSVSNVILDNDATGNGLGSIEPDVIDYNAPSTNVWIANRGTCNAGNAGC